MSNPIVEVKNLTKRFGDFTAVDNISFEIQEGETLGLLGPNGAGKTTTIHMLLGLITPTNGTIRLFGLDLEQHRETILRQINFSSTYISMPFSLTVEENLRVMAKLYGLSDVSQRIDEVIKTFEMHDIRKKLTRKLSTGQMTRLTLAKAVMTEPRVLFLDEPTASLDPDIAYKIKAFLKEYRNTSGLSMMYTSHNMQEMEEMSDRIIFLQRGKIVAVGTVEEIVERFGQRTLEDVFLKLAREE
ncbi:MAG: ATP-binding cassette domain-containing protein [Nitrospirales bacterium]|nr:ATP-binding cassette domain-containing protein [Nitrospirales bacterium]